MEVEYFRKLLHLNFKIDFCGFLDRFGRYFLVEMEMFLDICLFAVNKCFGIGIFEKLSLKLVKVEFTLMIESLNVVRIHLSDMNDYIKMI